MRALYPRKGVCYVSLLSKFAHPPSVIELPRHMFCTVAHCVDRKLCESWLKISVGANFIIKNLTKRLSKAVNTIIEWHVFWPIMAPHWPPIVLIIFGGVSNTVIIICGR